MFHIVIDRFNFKFVVYWIIGIIMFLYGAVLQIQIPEKLQNVINLAVKNQFKHIYVNHLVELLLFIIIISFISQLLVGLSSENIILNIRNKQFAQIIKQSSYNLNKSYAEISNRLTNDTEAIGSLFSSTIPNLCKEVIIFIGSLFLLFRLNKELFTMLMISVVIFAVFMGVIGIVLSKYSELFKQAGSDYLRIVLNLFENWNLIKVLNLEQYAVTLEKKQAQKLYKWSIKGILLSIFSGPIQLLFFSGLIITITYVIGKQLDDGTMNYGSIAALIMLLVNLLQSLIGTFNGFLEYKKDIGQLKGLRHISEILKNSVNIKNNLATHKPVKYITLNEVCIKKKDKNILKNVSYEFTDNYYTIMGENGVGKSTLVKAMLGLEVISSGNIYIPENYKIAYIEQNPKFFIGTIRDNVSFDKPISDTILIETLKKVNLWDAFKNRNGLDTLIRDTSVFSGGEAQKLSIARALTSKFDVLICDEITSNLDKASSILINNLLQDLSKSKQVIEITHHVINDNNRKILQISEGFLQEYEN